MSSCGFIGDATRDSKDRRNAQNIASVYASANAAGHDFIPKGEADLEAIVELVVTGHTIKAKNSPFDGVFFGIPSLSKTEQIDAAYYLKLNSSQLLVYDGSRPPKPLPKEQKQKIRIVAISVSAFIWLSILGLLFLIRWKSQTSPT